MGGVNMCREAMYAFATMHTHTRARSHICVLYTRMYHRSYMCELYRTGIRTKIIGQLRRVTTMRCERAGGVIVSE